MFEWLHLIKMFDWIFEEEFLMAEIFLVLDCIHGKENFIIIWNYWRVNDARWLGNHWPLLTRPYFFNLVGDWFERHEGWLSNLRAPRGIKSSSNFCLDSLSDIYTYIYIYISEAVWHAHLCYPFQTMKLQWWTYDVSSTTTTYYVIVNYVYFIIS